MYSACIRFPVASDVRSHWEAKDLENTDLFDRPVISGELLSAIQIDIPGFTGDFLRLYLEPEEYRPVYTGELTSVKNGWRSPFVVVGSRSYGFEAELTDFRPSIYHLIKSLEELIESDTQGETIVAVTCLDSCAIDTEADVDQGYTVRKGAIALERTKGLMAGEAGDLPISFGIRILFAEI